MKEQYQYLFDERIGILQHEGQMNPERAQRIAFLETSEILCKERFGKQTLINEFLEFKKQEYDMVLKTLYSWRCV